MIEFHVSRMNYLSLTEPSPGPDGRNPQYGLAVPVDELPVEIVNNLPHAVENASRGRWGLFSIRSARKPRLFSTSTYDELDKLVRYCEVTQTPIETLLREQPGVIACQLFEKTAPGSQDPFGVGLTAIQFDPGNVLRPSWEDLISQKVPI